MIDKITAILQQYYNQFMNWYRAADDVTQFGVMIAAGIAIAIVCAMFFLSRITK